MIITNIDWYKGKDILAHERERGRNPQPLHLIIAAVLLANESKLTVDQLCKMIQEANDYVPHKETTGQNMKALGF